MKSITTIASLGLILASALTTVACSDDSGLGGSATVADSSSGVADTLTPDIIIPPVDAGRVPDASLDADTRAAALAAVKDDPDWLVPGNIARRTAVAVSGTRVAWIEEVTDEPPLLVWWDTDDPAAAPTSIAIPNLERPRDLAFGDTHLVYVDDRYGDADLFAVELATGIERALVARPGAQERPAVSGTEVAWEDCRACVSGDGGAGREIYRRDLGDAGASAEVRVTDDAVADTSPTFGTLADGGPALAWVSGGLTLRVAGGATDVARAVGEEVAGVALTDGVLAWRPSRMILNPDSMRPSDVFLTTVATGDTRAATFHAELEAGLQLTPVADGGRIGWLESLPASPGMVRVRVVGLPDLAPVREADEDGVRTLALSAERVAFIAPRADNAGLDDVWIGVLP